MRPMGILVSACLGMAAAWGEDGRVAISHIRPADAKVEVKAPGDTAPRAAAVNEALASGTVINAGTERGTAVTIQLGVAGYAVLTGGTLTLKIADGKIVLYLGPGNSLAFVLAADAPDGSVVVQAGYMQYTPAPGASAILTPERLIVAEGVVYAAWTGAAGVSAGSAKVAKNQAFGPPSPSNLSTETTPVGAATIAMELASRPLTIGDRVFATAFSLASVRERSAQTIAGLGVAGAASSRTFVSPGRTDQEVTTPGSQPLVPRPSPPRPPIPPVNITQ